MELAIATILLPVILFADLLTRSITFLVSLTSSIEKAFVLRVDGTEGIKNLKSKKKVFVIGQEESTCTVYGMPKAVATAGLVDQVVKLENVAQEIIMRVGVN